ncbi:hypothetical protein GCM10025868_01960 [Angustibacter aerolatus]|uniref:Uncharacterized protein n=1 Tax=Angustibacter aerolatus TaxID=1162965 RepID=A0ABQ6JBG3_9ACTN|nr:hypothetical protein GCM10025868_01960 [Angustibacter aerolatus]
MRRFEVAELFGDHEQVLAEHVDALPDRSLQVRPLEDVLGGERGARHRSEHTVAEIEEHRETLRTRSVALD